MNCLSVSSLSIYLSLSFSSISLSFSNFSFLSQLVLPYIYLVFISLLLVIPCVHAHLDKHSFLFCQVVVLRKRSKDRHWDVAADLAVIPEGHDPSLGHFLFTFMLRLAPHVKKECVRRFKAFAPQVEISRRPQQEDQEKNDRKESGEDEEQAKSQIPAASSSSSFTGKTFQVVANEDLSTRMRELDEIRVYLENTPTFDEVRETTTRQEGRRRRRERRKRTRKATTKSAYIDLYIQMM